MLCHGGGHNEGALCKQDPQVKVRKRPLFEKSGAKTFLGWASGAETNTGMFSGAFLLLP
jgi:hypothetical protein